MTVTDQIKILDRKTKQNEAQYDLDRKAAKISASSSRNFDKYEYLTGEDDSVEEPLSLETKPLIEEIKIIQRNADYRKLKIIGSNSHACDFSDYKTFKELFRDIYYGTFKINKAKQRQYEFNAELNALSWYFPRNEKYIHEKSKLLDNVKNFYKGREKIIEKFKNKIFPIYHDDKDSRFEENDKNDIRDNNGLIDYKKLERLIDIKERDITDELLRKHFLLQDLVALLEKLKKSKNNAENNKIQVNLIKRGLRNFKQEIEDMSKEEKKLNNQMK